MKLLNFHIVILSQVPLLFGAPITAKQSHDIEITWTGLADGGVRLEE